MVKLWILACPALVWGEIYLGEQVINNNSNNNKGFIYDKYLYEVKAKIYREKIGGKMHANSRRLK